MDKPDVPRVKVETLAAQFRELMTLKDKQAQTQAQLIRWCLQALKREPRGHFDLRQDREERRAIRDNKIKAIYGLEQLVDMLENPSGNLSQPSTKGDTPCTEA